VEPDDLPYGFESTTGQGLQRGLRLVVPRPDTVLPRRTDLPWCERCGMTEGHHWAGCAAGR